LPKGHLTLKAIITNVLLGESGAPGESRTPDLLVRSCWVEIHISFVWRRLRPERTPLFFFNCTQCCTQINTARWQLRDRVRAVGRPLARRCWSEGSESLCDHNHVPAGERPGSDSGSNLANPDHLVGHVSSFGLICASIWAGAADCSA
jgi:hypothetical protein